MLGQSGMQAGGQHCAVLLNTGPKGAHNMGHAVLQQAKGAQQPAHQQVDGPYRRG